MGSIQVPADGEDCIRMTGDVEDRDSLGHVPDDDHVVIAHTGEDVVGRRMPVYCTNLSLVPSQRHEALRHLQHHLSIRNVPHLDGAVLAAAGNDVVIEGAPLDVQDRCSVSNDPATPVEVHPPDLLHGNHQEAAPAAHLHHHRHKLGVDSTEAAVVCVLGDADIIVAFLLLGRNTIHVTKLGTSHSPSTSKNIYFVSKEVLLLT